jgi:hypothetical protein
MNMGNSRAPLAPFFGVIRRVDKRMRIHQPNDAAAVDALRLSTLQLQPGALAAEGGMR